MECINASMQTRPIPFVLQMTIAARGEKVNHFRTIPSRKGEVKVFYSDTKVFIVKLDRLRRLESFEARVRRPNESLLGIEGSIEDALRRENVIN
jgi:hypothetical protein